MHNGLSKHVKSNRKGKGKLQNGNADDHNVRRRLELRKHKNAAD
jgi:hypothetical protein